MPPTKLSIANPNFPDSDRGQVMLSIQILQKSVAEANPVGDAQDEPNVNPYLPKPTEGRGS